MIIHYSAVKYRAEFEKKLITKYESKLTASMRPQLPIFIPSDPQQFLLVPVATTQDFAATVRRQLAGLSISSFLFHSTN